MNAEVAKVLLATDMTRRSNAALMRVLRITQALGAELHILHVVEPLSNDARVALMMFMQDAKTRDDALGSRVRQARQALEARLDACWRELPAADAAPPEVVKSVQVLEGYASDVILKQTRLRKIDLIVMGAHRRGPASTYVGTVAKRVQRRAEVLTMLVPYTAER